MSEETNLLITLFVVMPIVLIASIFYYSSERLSNCAICKRQLNMKVDRGWIKIDGKDHPVCTRCIRKANK